MLTWVVGIPDNHEGLVDHQRRVLHVLIEGVRWKGWSLADASGFGGTGGRRTRG